MKAKPLRKLRIIQRVTMLLLLAGTALSAADLVPVNQLGLRVTRGFRVSLYADSTLADDVHALTLDAAGNVVISGPGYIRTLYDRDGNGFADGSSTYAQPWGAAMGLRVVGNNLYYVGDDGLWVYQDDNGDGRADRDARQVVPLRTGEHGAHGFNLGPDGWFYLIGGNESGFSRQLATLPSSPILQPESGALVRFSPNLAASEIIAQGFRNPYAFDFNAWGDIFTADSDVQGDFLLPWYTPPRAYHVAFGAHHGWRMHGSVRSGNRLPYFPDSVDMITAMGRSAPSGVASYRHFQFPNYFRNGLFVADWLFGRVWFLPLDDNEASYDAVPVVFLEAMGLQGFAPTSLAVGGDGSLFVATGGRGVQGGVYRVDFADASAHAIATNWIRGALTPALAVLNAPQPQAEWSRSYWVPTAIQLGPTPFDVVASDDGVLPVQRIRAIEILTELHGGLATRTAFAAAQATSPLVRARVAWSLGREACDDCAPLFLRLARDTDSMVRRFALQAITERRSELDLALVQGAISANLAHPDPRIRQAAALLASLLPDEGWTGRWAQLADPNPTARLTIIMAGLWRSPSPMVNQDAAKAALEVLKTVKTPELQLQAMRMVELAFGDWRIQDPPLELYAAYELAGSLESAPALVAEALKTVRPIVSSPDQLVSMEAARLVAMFRDASAEAPGRILSLINRDTPAARDFHNLTAISRTRPSGGTNDAERVAGAFLGLDRKQASWRGEQDNWPRRWAELAHVLLARDSTLDDALLRHLEFARPAHVVLVGMLEPEQRVVAAQLFKKRVETDAQFPWTPELVRVLAPLPRTNAAPLFRQHWTDPAVRDDVTLYLADDPQVGDRERFVWGLTSPRPEVVRASMNALIKLPPLASALVPAMEVLDRLLNEREQHVMRAQALALVNHLTGFSIRVQERGADSMSLRRAYAPVLQAFSRKFPGLAKQLAGSDARAVATWDAALQTVDWTQGKAERGRVVFDNRGCAGCHLGADSLGPPLAPAVQRLGPAELIKEIVFPSRNVSPAYEATIFRTRSAGSYTGMVAFAAADVALLRTDPERTIRLSGLEAVQRQPSPHSMMPKGLLERATPGQLSDLYAYLRTLPGVNGP